MRTLGLDVGTNSIGWCLIEDTRIIDAGVRIIGGSPHGAGRDAQKGTPLAVERRNARAARRRRDRYLRRRAAFMKALVAHGLMPADQEEATLLTRLDPYHLRRRALTERLEPYEIGRALFHLNQRRGFKSNRKAERRSADDDKGKIAPGAKALDEAMAAEGARTLGAFLAGRPVKRVRLNSDNQRYDFYPLRQHYEDEFAAIWEAQATHHPALLTKEARAALHRILFHQRPLKEPEVGFCTAAGLAGIPADERRLPKAHPLFQRRRLYEEVNQLRIVAPGVPDRPLTLEERDKLVLKLQDKKKVSFDSLAKLLRLAEGERFNKESESRTFLVGDEIRAEMSSKTRFGTRWLFFSIDEQWRIIERLLNEEDPDELLDWLMSEYDLDEATASAVADAQLPEGYGRFGETATRRLLEALMADVVTYDKAALAAGFHHSDHRTGEVFERLPYYGQILTREIAPGRSEHGDPLERRYGKITNPTVHIGLRQIEKLINAVIERWGRPDRIVVEIARELKLNEKEKEAHRRRIKQDTEAAIARGKKLQEAGIPDTGANRMMLRLWEELNPTEPLDRRCPYCGEMIGMRQLFSGEIDVDHIIPYSRSLDDSAANKVVAHRSCNRDKSNRTPFERWGSDPERWNAIRALVTNLPPSKQWRFGPDAMQQIEGGDGFVARQLNDTQYLSRIAGKYLRCLYPASEDGRVDVIPGRMTAMLRRIWGLNSLLPDHNFVENEHSNAPKNRLDHRHHAIDAAVAAVTSLGLMQEIARTAGRAEEKELDRLFEDLPPPWPTFRDELGQTLQRTIVSHKPDHGRRSTPSRHRDVTGGKLHNDTAYGLTGKLAKDGKTPIVVHRVPLTALEPKDLADDTCIPDPVLRAALRSTTEGLTGSAFKQALARFAREDSRFKGIRRVRLHEALNVIPIRDRTGRAYKAFKGDANDRCDVWRLPDRSWQVDVVQMFDAHRRVQDDRRPHPAAKKILSLRKNDTIAIERMPGSVELLRVVGFRVGGRLKLAPLHEGGNLKDRDGNANDPFRYVSLSAKSLKATRARQVRIDVLGNVFDPGPRE